MDDEAVLALVEDWLVVDSIPSDEMIGEYTKVTDGFSGTSCLLETCGGGAVNSTGEDVTFAGLSMVDFGEAGSVKIGSAEFVGTAIDSACDNAIGGSQAPRQSNAQLFQAGSMPLTCGGKASCGW